MQGLTLVDRAREQRRRPRSRGVASLTAVLVLFFIMSLVAAYTSRNLIFEQRTSANQYRSTQAFEAAEAGIEWALAMLNTGRIDASCAPSADVANKSFRERYLEINDTTGLVSPVPRTDVPTLSLSAACVHNGAGWNCSCPSDGAPTAAEPSGNGVFPAFSVRFVVPAGTPVPGLIRLESNGCTRADANCLSFNNNPGSPTGDGRMASTAVIALQSALVAPPIAALTVHGTLDVGGSPIVGAFNSDANVGGISVLAGVAVNQDGLYLGGVAGTPPLQSVRIDPELAAPTLPDDRYFASFFGMWPNTYRDQPATVLLTCPLNVCNPADVRSAAARNPGRVIWAPGSIAFNSTGDLGAADDPVIVIATGSVTFPTAINVYGLVYSRAATWTTSGTGGTVRGAAVAQGSIDGSGSPTFVYDAAVLERLRRESGSFVRVPGGWKDFR